MSNKIKFKKIDTIDFNSVFPVISKDYFSLIENTVLEITEQQETELLKNNSITLGNVVISSALFDIDEKTIETTSNWVEHVIDIKKQMDLKYMFMDPLVDAICHGVELQENVMLYGRGGHNKSEGSLFILKCLRDKGLISDSIYVKSFGDGTTTEDLFGGIQLDLYMKENKILYNVLESFMNYEIVLFEEFYDAPPAVLLVLKDILTSGYFRNGDQMFKIKCKCVIALTNKSKDEVATDRSIEALTQRFPITQLIEWPKDAYKKSNFIKLLNKVRGKDVISKFKDKAELLAIIAEETNNGNSSEKFISPRSLIKASKSYFNGADLTVNIDFDPEVVDRVIKSKSSNRSSSSENLKYYQDLLSRYSTFVKDKSLDKLDDPLLVLTAADPIEIERSRAIRKNQAETMIYVLETTVFDSQFVSKKEGLLQILKDTIKQ